MKSAKPASVFQPRIGFSLFAGENRITPELCERFRFEALETFWTLIANIALILMDSLYV